MVRARIRVRLRLRLGWGLGLGLPLYVKPDETRSSSFCKGSGRSCRLPFTFVAFVRRWMTEFTFRYWPFNASWCRFFMVPNRVKLLDCSGYDRPASINDKCNESSKMNSLLSINVDICWVVETVLRLISDHIHWEGFRSMLVSLDHVVRDFCGIAAITTEAVPSS